MPFDRQQQQEISAADENARIPWELHKENIQPLSHGRKMSFLNQSLSSTGAVQPRSDQEIAQAIQALEEEIITYVGDDPLGGWVRCAVFYEQNCLTSGKYQAKYNELLKSCVRKFLNQDPWKNDKRFVDILLKSFSSFAPEKRVAIIHNCVINQDVGRNVSRMYTQIAEDYEALKKYDKASEILELGKRNNAQPPEFLEEFQKNFQFRVAARVCQSIKENEATSAAAQDSRLFGASIPLVGPQFEAQNLRTGLVIADPSRARPAPLVGNGAEPRRVAIYHQNENENMPPPPPKTHQEAVKEIEGNLNDKLDKENVIEATKWSKPDTVLAFNPPPAAAPVEKIQIYEDSEKSVVVVPVRKPRKTTSRAALGEVKLEPEDELSPKDKVLAPVAATNDPCKDIVASSAPVTTAAAVAEPARAHPANIIQGLALPLPPENGIEAPEIMPTLPSNQRIMCRIKDLWQDGKEVTFEHLRVAEYKKRKICAQDLINQTRSLVQATKAQSPPQQPLPDPRLAELEAENAALKLHNAELQKRQVELETRQAELETRLMEAEIRAKQDRSRQVEMVLEAIQSQQINLVNLQASANQGKENVFAEPTSTFAETARSITRPAYQNYESSRRIVVEPESDDTEAILTRQANIQPEFDLSNLTRALHFNPHPIHNSTPEKPAYSNDSGRNAQPRPMLMDIDMDAGGQGTTMPAYTYAKANFNATMHVAHNLSTIQENSKESRASSTTTSSSGSTANYTKSAQKTGHLTGRSQLATSAHAHSNFQYNPGDWTN